MTFLWVKHLSRERHHEGNQNWNPRGAMVVARGVMGFHWLLEGTPSGAILVLLQKSLTGQAFHP